MLSRLKSLVVTALAMAIDSVDPVCQNRNAVIIGRYKGFIVHLVPVEGADGCVESWIPDPNETQRIDAILASNPGLAIGLKTQSMPPQPAPQQAPQQPAPPPPPLPPLP